MWEKSANQAASPEIKKFPSFKLNFLPIWYICLANFQWPEFLYKNCLSIPTISIPNNNTIGGYKSFGSGELIADVVIIPGPGHAQILSKMFRPTNIDYRKHKKSEDAISCLMLTWTFLLGHQTRPRIQKCHIFVLIDLLYEFWICIESIQLLIISWSNFNK